MLVFWKKSYDQPRQYIKKQRHYFANKGPFSQSYGFSMSHVWLFATPWTAACQASCPSSTPRVYPNSSPLSRWSHPTLSSSVVPFSSHPQFFPASGSFQISQLFTSGGQSIGVSVSTSVLPMNTQDRSPLGWTGWISLQSKGLSEESLPLVLINELHPSTFKSAIHSKLTLASIFFFFFYISQSWKAVVSTHMLGYKFWVPCGFEKTGFANENKL